MDSSAKPRRQRQAITPEARENQLIAQAVDLVERQIQEGTASSQVLTHYLKLASTRNRLEERKLQLEAQRLETQIKDLERLQQSEQVYAEALEAMRAYKGETVVEDI